ncbi:MAG: hypothetical protein V1752_04280 [Candidatus Firestonebacteria bacterium]
MYGIVKDNISGNMSSLCEGITAAHGDRKKSISGLKEQAETVRKNAKKFVNHCRKVHKEMAESLTKGLKEDRKELIKNATSLREDFRKKEKEIRTDLAEAGKIWNNMNKTLQSKKRSKIK